MMHSLVDDLVRLEADVVVTITAPLDRRRPNNDEDRIQLRNLLATARDQVRDQLGVEDATPIVQNLDAAVSTVDMRRGAHGVIIVATAHDAESQLLSFPVRPAVALESTPATRFLVQGLRRSPRYRLLVVSDRATRLFEAIRDDLVEVTDHGFPFTADVVPRDLRAITGRFALAKGRDDKEQWRNFYRMVDTALTEASRDDALPIVVAGVKNSTSMFESASRNSQLIIGRVDGAHEHASAHDLGTAAWPILRDYLKRRRREAVSEVVDAFHAERAVVGIDEVWQAARQGRGRSLVVDENYRAVPMREIDGLLVPTDDVGPDVMDDPIDELIEHVLRAGGSVEFVGPGALVDVGHVALLLR